MSIASSRSLGTSVSSANSAISVPSAKSIAPSRANTSAQSRARRAAVLRAVPRRRPSQPRHSSPERQPRAPVQRGGKPRHGIEFTHQPLHRLLARDTVARRRDRSPCPSPESLQRRSTSCDAAVLGKHPIGEASPQRERVGRGRRKRTRRQESGHRMRWRCAHQFHAAKRVRLQKRSTRSCGKSVRRWAEFMLDFNRERLLERGAQVRTRRALPR